MLLGIPLDTKGKAIGAQGGGSFRDQCLLCEGGRLLILRQ